MRANYSQNAESKAINTKNIFERSEMQENKFTNSLLKREMKRVKNKNLNSHFIFYHSGYLIRIKEKY